MGTFLKYSVSIFNSIEICNEIYLLIFSVSKLEWDGMDWIDLAQDTDQWKGLVNTVMNLRVT
jgi:hypothetical protein